MIREQHDLAEHLTLLEDFMATRPFGERQLAVDERLQRTLREQLQHRGEVGVRAHGRAQD